ncbi:flagellar protein FliT [Azohydromonas lata]|uniref:Flagellar protein FliT n=1 Tax=Azohydromonas lata TaxID=45677 RepID=A0ABU5IEH9_9BURK|nr:flagellar protein FliT [Azohydromonas lata]MDZ5457239.1 flagellar protein FliT [Azohydromonas lata]
MNTSLLSYYEAIEKTSADMLLAAQRGDWQQFVALEGTCGNLISQLRQAGSARKLPVEQARAKARILQRILLNDAQIRRLAEPWLDELDAVLAARPRTVH